MLGGLTEHFRSSGTHSISHAWDLNVIVGCLFLHIDIANFNLWSTHHIANIVVIFVYCS